MRPLLAPVLAVAALSAAPLAAQTADQARLVFSVGIGQSSGGGELWSIGRQPFLVSPSRTDTLSLRRSFRRSLNVVLSGTYFPGNHLGYNVEAQMLGLATEDDCSKAGGGMPAPPVALLCNTINRHDGSGSAVALSGGLIYRFAPQQPLHPYIRANVGFLVSQESFIKVGGPLGDSLPVASDAVIYADRNSSSIRPTVSFGGGLVAVIGRGYQFRFELRDNWVQVPKILGATSIQGVRPATDLVGKHILTATLGFDVVLERKRGRRY
ncbi:MAG: hypothetical protein U0133_14425 [Gemmatimonadales bacterium]